VIVAVVDGPPVLIDGRSWVDWRRGSPITSSLCPQPYSSAVSTKDAAFVGVVQGLD
jgi:hypothetical protein